MNTLASSANGKSTLEGKPYQFLFLKLWIINDPVDSPNLASSSPIWSAATRDLLSGIQVGDIVANVSRPASNFARGKEYGPILRLKTLPATTNVQTGLIGTVFESLRFQTPQWRSVQDFTERDAIYDTRQTIGAGQPNPNLGYGLLNGDPSRPPGPSNGTLPDGTIIIVFEGPFIGGPLSLPKSAWDLNTINPVIEVRRDGLFKYYLGMLSELNRMRHCIGRQLNAVDQTVSLGGFAANGSACVSKRYIYANAFPSGGVLVCGPNSFSRIPLQMKDIDVTYPANLGATNWKRSIVIYCEDQFDDPNISSSNAWDGTGWRWGFSSQVSTGGILTGKIFTVTFAVYDDAVGVRNTNADFTETGTVFKWTKSGTLAPYITVTRRDGVNVSRWYEISFDTGVTTLGSGDWWLQLKFECLGAYHFNATESLDRSQRTNSPTVNPKICYARMHRAVVVPDFPSGFTFYPSTDISPRLVTDYADPTADEDALHTTQTIKRVSFPGNYTTSRLPQGSPNSFSAYKNGENLGVIQFIATVTGGTHAHETGVGHPLGASSDVGDGTVMDQGFAPHQYDSVPLVGELVTSPSPGVFRQSVAKHNRQPYAFALRQIHLATYPVVYDPFTIGSYVAFNSNPGFGQIVQIVATRIPQLENTVGAGAVTVQAGVYRSGSFVQLASFTIPDGSNYGLWNPVDPNPGIEVFEFFPLVIKCASSVAAYAKWFHPARSPYPGLGDGSLGEPTGTAMPLNKTVPCSLPVNPDHYIDTVAALALIT